jgi:DNA-binding MarR family transcriptional regulator
METKNDIIREASQTLYRLLNKHSQLEALPVYLHDGIMITHRELHVIQAIGEKSPVNITDLGTHFGVSKSAISQMVSKLAAKSLIEKNLSSHSNKEFELSLTNLGSEAFQIHEKNHGEHMSDLINRLNAFSLTQIATMSVILETMENAVDERIEKRIGKE